MHVHRTLSAVAGLIGLAVLGAWLGSDSGSAQAQQQVAYGDVSMPLRAIAVQLKLGLNDQEPTQWDGRFKLPARRVSAIEGTSRSGSTGWQARSSRPAPSRRAPAVPPPVQPAQLMATLAVGLSTTVEVTTSQGDFSFRAGQLAYGVDHTFFDGRVAVARIPLVSELTNAPTDDDFPTLSTAPDGSVWCAYVSYTAGPPVDNEATARGEYESLVAKGNGDQIRLMRFAGEEWSAAMEVTEAGLDVWKPAVAVDREGTVWIVWSQNKSGNWDLYARSYDSSQKRFGGVRRLTTEPGADINVVAARSADSGIWIAWQGWRDGNFDIWLAQLGPEGAARTQRVSSSRANDWNPAIAVSGTGKLWIAWDTYDKGDYDVYVRGFENGRAGEVVPIATSPRFEARPSAAVDARGRVWIAFEDAAPNWGKDYGDRWPWNKGVPFYIERYVKIRCLENGRLSETHAELRSDLIDSYYDDPRKPVELRHRISIPRLTVDARGRLWLLYRRHPLRSGIGERWTSFASYYEGAKWSPEIPLPHSDSRLDNRPAVAALGDDGVLVVYSTDRRKNNVRDSKKNDIQAAWFSLGEQAQPPALRTVAAGSPTGPRDAPVHPGEAKQVERTRSYRVQVQGKSLRYLRGEFHRHTEISSHRDWDGPLEEVWRYGLDVAAMDWIGPGDHDYGVGLDYLWWLTQKQIDIYHHPGVFTPMFTYERSAGYPSGHRNVMFARRGIRPLPRLQGRERMFGTPEKGSDDIRNLYGFLRHFGGICSSHTSATNMGTDWRDNDREVEPVVEIFQGHRQNYEETNAPLAPRGPGDTIQGYRPLGFVWNAFRKGRRLGFQSSSDHVSTHISYAIVIAEEPTRQGILAAFKKRHSYAAHDNIVLDVRSGDHIMGDAFTLRSLPRLDIRVIGTAPIAKIEIIRQNEGRMPIYVAAFQPNQAEASLSWTDQAVTPDEVTMYYVRVIQHDRKMAWASPMWIRYEPESR
jgi:hypothetical protein